MDGPKKPRGTPEPAGLKRHGRPTAEKIGREKEVPSAFSEIAKDIRASLTGMPLNGTKLEYQRKEMRLASTREIEKMLNQLKTAGLDDKHEIALAAAEEYEERMKQEEQEPPESDF